jgi:hypothetical protein
MILLIILVDIILIMVLIWHDFPSTVSVTLWYTVQIRLCTIWFRIPIQILDRLPLLGMKGDWVVMDVMEMQMKTI